MFRILALLCLAAGSSAQIFGNRGARANNDLSGMSQEERDHMQGSGAAAVEKAMQGWDELANNPDSMAELMESFNDPEVKAKAREMINDPEYMKAAKKKLEEMQRKAQGAGLLDKNGQPLPGAATQAAGANPAAAALMQQMLKAQQMTQQAQGMAQAAYGGGGQQYV